MNDMIHTIIGWQLVILIGIFTLFLLSYLVGAWILVAMLGKEAWEEKQERKSGCKSPSAPEAKQ